MYLTILTFIGCAVELYNNLSLFLRGKKHWINLKKIRRKLAEAAGMGTKFAGPEVHEMMVTRLWRIDSHLCSWFDRDYICFYGALQMRKLKKEGYTFWMYW